MSDKNKKELVQKVNRLVQSRYGGSFEDAFKHYGGRDEKVSADELGVLLDDASVGNMFTRSMWVSGIMREMDRDMDGQITWREFERVIEADT